MMMTQGGLYGATPAIREVAYTREQAVCNKETAAALVFWPPVRHTFLPRPVPARAEGANAVTEEDEREMEDLEEGPGGEEEEQKDGLH